MLYRTASGSDTTFYQFPINPQKPPTVMTNQWYGGVYITYTGACIENSCLLTLSWYYCCICRLSTNKINSRAVDRFTSLPPLTLHSPPVIEMSAWTRLRIPEGLNTAQKLLGSLDRNEGHRGDKNWNPRENLKHCPAV